MRDNFWPGGVEIYVPAPERTTRLLRHFLDTFAPLREPSQEPEYPVPAFADTPELVLTTEDDLLALLDDRPHVEYGLYWRNLDKTSSVSMAMAFYTEDRGLILGLVSTSSEAYEETATRLKALATTDLVYIVPEQRPPSTMREFVRWCIAQREDL